MYFRNITYLYNSLHTSDCFKSYIKLSTPDFYLYIHSIRLDQCTYSSYLVDKSLLRPQNENSYGCQSHCEDS